jgi:transcriptional regulator with GAF, ATPase, and Fis domain
MQSIKALRPFLHGLEEGVLFLNEDRRIIAINMAATQMIGQMEDDVVGRLCPNVFQGAECARNCSARNSCSLMSSRKQAALTDDLALNRPDGSQIFLKMWAVLLSEPDISASCAVILRDRTREVLLEEEVNERLRLGGMIGHGPAMRELFRNILRSAMSNATALILGESGTGKELVARALHDNSSRAQGPYIRVHCASFSESLLESELFGHIKGAFTGAVTDRLGRFEAAHGGTILLDEIGEISPAIQVKLLRVLQEREVERVGENKPRKVDVRVIAATNRDLKEMIRNGKFREDLYYRLNVLPILTPPLRERTEDILLLAQALLSKMTERDDRGDVQLSVETISMLESYPWPGNVRELSNALEYALVQTTGKVILPHHFPQELTSSTVIPGRSPPKVASIPPTPKTTGYYCKPDDASEQEQILRALRETKGNKLLAAKMLGMSRTTLWKRIKTYEIEVK